jgi:putative transposase
MEIGSLDSRRELVVKTNKISIRKQCSMLSVSRGSYYIQPKGESEINLELMKRIDKHNLEHPYKGVLQMQDYLASQGHQYNEKRIRRLMRKMCIEAIYPKVNLSRLGKAKYIRPYLLRELEIAYPNQVWAIDISYIPMKNGFMYLTVVIDWYSRYIVGWQLSNTLEAETQTDLVKGLVAKYGKPEIINSDQGSQYTCHNWIDTMKELDIKISMDGKGRATDNAIVERVFRTIKREYIYLNPENKVTELRQGLNQYINYYNTKRTHQGINRKTPIHLYQSINTNNNQLTPKTKQSVV